MTSNQIRDWLSAASEDLDRLLMPTEGKPTIVQAVHRMYDARPALPGAQAFDTDRVSSSSSSSNPPPGFGQQDKAEQDRIELHKRAKRIRDDLDWLTRCTQRWSPREPTPKDRQLSSLNEKDEGECEVCRTIGKWERLLLETNVKGNLDRSYKLGAWCYRFTLDTGALPTRKQLEDHHNGVRVKRPA
jgi:hypothetical protein